eukprot:CAMPEP_0119037294 /NCGR_PEP_ID=MMETSP1177-20130426/5573_1 /TAXON_ID=2985 /ORGANISM="Ochromonas sp, Strain CCMP1899" /LENGTH=303 /DNA_ID=CAMNT_0006998367 /DNA_START=352 /DNA_END=1263 /DNA_ORIENTATION=-
MLAFFTSRAQSFYNSLAKRSIITTAGGVKKFKNTQFYSGDNYGAENYSGIAGRVETTKESKWAVNAIGVIVSPYQVKFETPKQATISRQDGGAQAGSIRLFPGYEDCIDKLDGFDFIWVITYMHLNSGFKSKIKPQPLSGQSCEPVGLFASRAPHRPNPIALSALKVTGVDVAAGIINVFGLDLLDGTPVLDIKPYVAAFDSFPDARAGWMDDLTKDKESARETGYQNIVSNRGARAARAARRKIDSESDSEKAKSETASEMNDSDIKSETDILDEIENQLKVDLYRIQKETDIRKKRIKGGL